MRLGFVVLFAWAGVCGVSGGVLDAPVSPPVVPEPRQVPSSVLPPPAVPKPRQSSCTFSHAFTAVGDQALLQSPNYPSNYPSYANCKYYLTSPPGSAIKIECNEFNVEAGSSCGYDVFQLSLSGDSQFRDAARFCGRGTLSRTSTTNALNVAFSSDGANPSSAYPYRFQCLLTAVASSSSVTTAAPTTTTTLATTAAPVPTTASPAGCTCGVRNEAMRVVGGTEAKVNEFPWRCALANERMGVFCGSTIIANQWILTAAHCTAAIPAGTKTYVYCSEHDLASTTESQTVVGTVSQIVQHESYNSQTQDNDISLLKLAAPLTFSRTVQPVCLPFNMVGQSVDNLTVIASGWGTTSSGGSPSKTLLKVELPCLGTTACQKYYGSAVTNNMICTYKKGSDTCQGDSGGSIDYKDPKSGAYEILGVVSWGVGCAGENQPGVYAKVTNFLNWIISKTGDNYCRI